MKKKKVFGTLAQELGLLIAAVITFIPIYYFVISAFKKRTNIVKFPWRSIRRCSPCRTSRL